MHLALALDVPEEVAATISPLRARWGHGRLLPPHLTLLYPFVPTRGEAQVVAVIRRVLAETAPIPVRLGQVRAIEASRTIYVEVADEGAASHLYDRLLEALAGMIYSERAEYLRFREHGFLPHLTLTDEIHTADFRKARRELAGMRFTRAFTVTHATLYRTAGHDWEPHTRFRLGVGEEAGRA